MRPYSIAVLVLAILGVSCASLQAPTIEGALEQVRAACTAIGEPDLDACAARLKDAGK